MTKASYKTNNRTKILGFLMENSNRAMSVNDINAHLQEIDCPVNTTTIYRYLDKLEKDNHVIKYGTAYQYVDEHHGCHEHLHLKCTSCETITHLDCHFMDEIEEHICKDHGFQIQCKESVIYGLCSRCQREKQKR
ncbi:Fur family ferric uptake transcriptional regulator [Clostridiales Family XIII bacterium PM5-7]